MTKWCDNEGYCPECPKFNGNTTLMKNFNEENLKYADIVLGNLPNCEVGRVSGEMLKVQNCLNNNLIEAIRKLQQSGGSGGSGEGGDFEQIQVDWNQTDITAIDYIKNKPDLYTKKELDDKIAKKGNVKSVNGVQPDSNGDVAIEVSGGGTQIQSDWNQNSSTQPDYIKNKPDLYTKKQIDDKIATKGNVKTVNGVAPDTSGNVEITVEGGDTELPENAHFKTLSIGENKSTPSGWFSDSQSYIASKQIYFSLSTSEVSPESGITIVLSSYNGTKYPSIIHGTASNEMGFIFVNDDIIFKLSKSGQTHYGSMWELFQRLGWDR